jgi:hypothetical protein
VSFLKDDRNALYHHVVKKMRVAALLVAVIPITVGIVGIVSPDSLANARLHLMQTAGALYITGPVRVAMGLVLRGLGSFQNIARSNAFGAIRPGEVWPRRAWAQQFENGQP